MAQARYEYVKRKNAPSTAQSGTATYDLPENGFIPEITITAYSTPTAATDPALPISEAITKIEIVDGAEVLVSLSANQLKGISMIRGDRSLASPETNDNAVEGHDDIRIILGGFYNGVNYAPNFANFNNPQLKISWDYSLTTGARGATYDADAAPVMKFTVLAKVVADTSQYTHGYVKTSEIKTFVQAASSTEQTEIPRGEPLLGIAIEAGYDAKHLTDDLNEIKLDFNNGEWRPLHLYADEVISVQKMWFKEPFSVSFSMDLIDAVEIDTHIGFVSTINGTAGSSAGRVVEYDGADEGVEAVGFMDAATPTAIATYEQVKIQAIGWCPFGIWYLPVSKLLNGTGDTLDTTAWRRILLELVSSASASTSSTPSIIAEYLIT